MKSIVPIIYLFFILSNNIYSQNCEYALIPGISQMNAIRSPGGLPESGKPGIQSNYQNIICNIDKEPNAELELLWRKDLNTTVSSPLLIGANKIYAAAVNGKIYSFDLDGNLIWQNSTGGTIYSRPVLSDSILFLGTNEGDLVSINADNGKIIQTLGLNESITSLHIIQDIEYNGAETKGIIIGTSKGSLYCYDVNSLEMIWENHSAQGKIETMPLLINGRIIFGSSDKYVYCIEAKSGIINWKWPGSSYLSLAPYACAPVSNGTNIFIASPDGYAASIDLALGSTAWRKNNLEDCGAISMSGNKEELFIKSIRDNFYILSAKNGKFIKNIKTNNESDTTLSEIIEWNNNVLFGSQNGNIYIIDKYYKLKALLLLEKNPVRNIYQVKENIFAASNLDGRIVVFKIANL